MVNYPLTHSQSAPDRAGTQAAATLESMARTNAYRPGLNSRFSARVTEGDSGSAEATLPLGIGSRAANALEEKRLVASSQGTLGSANEKAPSGWVFRSGPIFRSLEVGRDPFPPQGTDCESKVDY
jgi:hypothetical protein